MVDRITIHKTVNGYLVNTNWTFEDSSRLIHFKDMAEVVKHLDDCFVRPLKDLTYVTKIKEVDTVV